MSENNQLPSSAITHSGGVVEGTTITNDEQTPLMSLRALVAEFVNERNWEKFHSPKNLSMSLAIEAAELMEHFQWLTIEASQQMSTEERNQVGEELADVICYGLALANAMSIDVSQAVVEKMKKNRRKYPVGCEFDGKKTSTKLDAAATEEGHLD